jgi:hypothetical protein
MKSWDIELAEKYKYANTCNCCNKRYKKIKYADKKHNSNRRYT